MGFIGQQVVAGALFHASFFFVVWKTLRVGGLEEAPLGRDAARVVENPARRRRARHTGHRRAQPQGCK